MSVDMLINGTVLTFKFENFNLMEEGLFLILKRNKALALKTAGFCEVKVTR
jgi:hypothetical protein